MYHLYLKILSLTEVLFMIADVAALWLVIRNTLPSVGKQRGTQRRKQQNLFVMWYLAVKLQRYVLICPSLPRLPQTKLKYMYHTLECRRLQCNVWTISFHFKTADDNHVSTLNYIGLVNHYCQKTNRPHTFIEDRRCGPSHDPQWVQPLQYKLVQSEQTKWQPFLFSFSKHNTDFSIN